MGRCACRTGREAADKGGDGVSSLACTALGIRDCLNVSLAALNLDLLCQGRGLSIEGGKIVTHKVSCPLTQEARADAHLRGALRYLSLQFPQPSGLHCRLEL